MHAQLEAFVGAADCAARQEAVLTAQERPQTSHGARSVVQTSKIYDFNFKDVLAQVAIDEWD
jgi:hypothetical protein